MLLRGERIRPFRVTGTLRYQVPLPVAAKIDAWLTRHGELSDASDLFAVGDAAAVFPPGCLLGVAEEIGAGDVVVVTGLGPAKAAEVLLGPVGASAVVGIGLGMDDALHLV